MEKQFSKKEALRVGLEMTRRHFGFLLIVLLTAVLTGVLLDSTSDLLAGFALPVKAAGMVAVALIAFMIEFGTIRIALCLADGKAAHLGDLFSPARLLWKYIAATILYWVIIACGLFLLIVPGIIWAIKFGYYPYVILDKGLGPFAALNGSARITNGAKLELFFFGALLIAINIAGLMALVAGLLVTIPLTMIASAFVYRRLSAGTDSDLFKVAPVQGSGKMKDDGPFNDAAYRETGAGEKTSGRSASP
ncbi:MAG: hypothetical protein AAB539_00265 [Patescibacteria group bacterium]